MEILQSPQILDSTLADCLFAKVPHMQSQVSIPEQKYVNNALTTYTSQSLDVTKALCLLSGFPDVNHNDHTPFHTRRKTPINRLYSICIYHLIQCKFSPQNE